ncbi:MAG: hypothetical protein ACR2JF_03010 [Iamia sp.]
MKRLLPTLVALGLVVSILTGCGSGDGGDDASPSATGAAPTDAGAPSTGAPSTTEATTTTAPPPELPRGGREIFPAHRVVAYYGNPGTAALGVLGETPPEEAAARVEAAAAPFDRPDRPVLPAFELIVTVAQAAPGSDGDYSAPTDLAVVERWHAAARAAGMLLILDIQPGRAPFLPEVQRYESLLREPDVGLALDSEWRMGPDEVPGQTIGSVAASEVNEVSAWLADIVADEDLPEKIFLLHLFTPSMIEDRDAVVDRPGLATVFHVDGFGGQEIKIRKYAELKGTGTFASGLKLFFDEDIDIFSPEQVLGIDPDVDLITYQ